jgi:cell division protein ZapA (FtsZ GTPase activity inhibitor)
LTGAQKDLGIAIEKVVALTGERDAEVNTAMAEMKQQSGGAGAEQAVLITAQQMLDEIAKTFSANLKGPAAIESAKAMSLKATDFARQLKELAEKTTDPVYKEKLYTASKIIRDGSLQIKILSAVRAAGGEDSGNTVGMAVKGLQSNIQDVMKDIAAENIR